VVSGDLASGWCWLNFRLASLTLIVFSVGYLVFSFAVFLMFFPAAGGQVYRLGIALVLCFSFFFRLSVSSAVVSVLVYGVALVDTSCPGWNVYLHKRVMGPFDIG